MALTATGNTPRSWYRRGCRDCDRLAAFLDEVREEHADYFCRPVPPFGDRDARLLVVGLAPGKHGANATGRPFTGDYAGVLLYDTLFRYGFASRPVSESADDGLVLANCRITNAVKCLPPANKPTGAEVARCNHYLQAELTRSQVGVVLALGQLAHRAVLRSLGLTLSRYRFGHGVRHRLNDDLVMVSSYHCSRYNTQTRRLTGPMFDSVFDRLVEELAASA